MKFAVALIASATAVEFGYDEYEHSHTIIGTEAQFNDVEVYYDEIEYAIQTKVDTEVRTRQVPITTSFSQIEVKYRPEEEIRQTPAYEINYRPNDYQRFTWEPRIVYGYYTETKYQDVPFTTYETHYEINYRDEEEHRYRTEIEILERLDSETLYRDEPETRYTNEYTVLYRTDEEVRYNTVFDTQYRIEHETEYRTEEEVRYNTVYETEYQPVISIETREVPVINYETAYRDEEEITYVTEYETRTRDVPVERIVEGYASNDSGDGAESEPGFAGGRRGRRFPSGQGQGSLGDAGAGLGAGEVLIDDGSLGLGGAGGAGGVLISDGGAGLGGSGRGRGGRGGYRYAQWNDYGPTSDSSDDL